MNSRLHCQVCGKEIKNAKKEDRYKKGLCKECKKRIRKSIKYVKL